MKVALVGSGNVATVLGRLMVSKGHEVVHVFNRNVDHARTLAMELRASYSDLKGSFSAEMFIVSVSDSAIEHCIQEIKANDAIVVHTAGAISKDILKAASQHYGVLYPLQTIRKESPPKDDLPFLIDANNETTLEHIRNFALSLSAIVHQAGDVERTKLHTAAVVVSNFPNHLYLLAEEFCKKEDLDFNILLPLISETAIRLSFLSPSQSQTGPAIRNDQATIEKHISLLKEYPRLKDVYIKLTQSIQNSFTTGGEK